MNRRAFVRLWLVCLSLWLGPVLFLSAAEMTENPLLHESSLPYHYPQFDKVRDEHFAPAYEAGMAEHAREVEKIASNPARPTFENTVVPMERAGQTLERVSRIFGNLN